MSKKFVLLAVIAAVSLCAFANVEKSQARAGVKFGSAYTIALGGVTNIKEIVNRTSSIVVVSYNDFETSFGKGRQNEEIEIPVNGIWTGDLWVPWANDSREFGSHKIRIYTRISHPTQRGGHLNTLSFAVWQTGEYVRFNDADGFVNNAPKVTGEARAGGERRLVISTKNNRPVFTFEKYTE